MNNDHLNESIKNYIVVGGSKGIGRELSKKLLKQKNVRIILLSRNNIDIKSPNIKHFRTDLASLNNLNKTLEFIKKKYENIQGIIFLQKFRPIIKSKNDLALELRVSVESTKIIIEFFKDMFVENSSKSIVVIGSIASKFVAEEQSIDYHIAKSALVGLVNYYAVSLASKGIHINMLSPSTTIKKENKSFYKENKKLSSLYNELSPLKKMMKSQNIVDVIKFLLSKKSKYINGQNIIIDGGISLVWQEVIGRKYANIKTKVTQ
jgi:NAD(P)-dependent dehydrogenase (short-subunit alcohol dehydrogenase family)